METTPTTLINFQQDLLSSVSDQSVSTDSFVALKLDDDLWLIDLAHLKEASVPSKIARHAHAPTWIVGISNFKGSVWTVLDMKVLLKNEQTVNPSWGWVTLLRPGFMDVNSPSDQELSDDSQGGLLLQEALIGLLWTEIVEIASKGEYDVHPMLPEKWCRAHYKDKNGIIWKELDVKQIKEGRSLINNQ